MRYRKSIKLAPGVKLNLSKSGISTTIGTKGLSVNSGKRGTYLNTGIPGTGIYDRKKISGGKSNSGCLAVLVVIIATSVASAYSFYNFIFLT